MLINVSSVDVDKYVGEKRKKRREKDQDISKTKQTSAHHNWEERLVKTSLNNFSCWRKQPSLTCQVTVSKEEAPSEGLLRSEVAIISFTLLLGFYETPRSDGTLHLGFALVPKLHRTIDIRQNFFTIKVFAEWNSLHLLSFPDGEQIPDARITG